MISTLLCTLLLAPPPTTTAMPATTQASRPAVDQAALSTQWLDRGLAAFDAVRSDVPEHKTLAVNLYETALRLDRPADAERVAPFLTDAQLRTQAAQRLVVAWRADPAAALDAAVKLVDDGLSERPLNELFDRLLSAGDLDRAGVALQNIRSTMDRGICAGRLARAELLVGDAAEASAIAGRLGSSKPEQFMRGTIEDALRLDRALAAEDAELYDALRAADMDDTAIGRALWARADALIETGKSDAALPMVQRIEDASFRVVALQRCADSLIKSGDIGRAGAFVRHALELLPRLDPGVRDGVARALWPARVATGDAEGVLREIADGPVIDFDDHTMRNHQLLRVNETALLRAGRLDDAIAFHADVSKSMGYSPVGGTARLCLDGGGEHRLEAFYATLTDPIDQARAIAAVLQQLSGKQAAETVRAAR